jgi:glutathione-regulated potassium-efflux system ancillary protein KefG
MARKILIVFAHPSLRRSRTGRALAEAVRDLEGCTLHDLYEEYPDGDIDVEREKGLLLEHDVIVLQHPFYWYSVPPLLKEWIDLVLEFGWAYGPGGDRLRGKGWMSAITTGGGLEAYSRKGHNRYTVRELLAPVEQTGRLCGMDWLGPFAVHATHALSDTEIRQHAVDYRRLLEAVRDDRLDRKRADRLTHLNADLAAVIRED